MKRFENFQEGKNESRNLNFWEKKFEKRKRKMTSLVQHFN